MKTVASGVGRQMDRVVQRVVLFGAIAIVLVIGMQSYWMLQSWRLSEKDFDRTVNIALMRVAQAISLMNQTPVISNGLINRPSSNYYVVNTNSPIDASTLDFYLRKEFEAVSLNEDFEYGIYDCHNQEMVYGNYISFTTTKDTNSIDKSERNLPQFKELTYYFGVRFPKRSSYVLSGMNVTLFFSGVLIITIFFFIYSLAVILRQRRLSELQKDFINNMTHEFKTPISTVKIAAEVFANAPVVQQDPRLTQYANIMKEQNNRLNTQVEKVLQLAKIDGKTLDLNVETINLHELLHSIIPSIEVKIEELKGTLTTSFATTSAFIKADSLHFTNILHNLLDNAMKYRKEIPEITISTFNNDKVVTLTISDNGIGIDRNHQKMVFDRFYRVPTGNVHNVKGFGLGLFYVKNICKAHGWQVRLDSQLDKGTSISIEIPKI